MITEDIKREISRILKNYHNDKNMKTIAILILLVFPLLCYSQGMVTSLDSKSKYSRAKADSVLRSFENFHVLKMLYSVRDSEYYVILKKGTTYEEYFVLAKELQTLKIFSLNNEKPNLKIFKRIFKLKKYHTGFITKMPNAKFIQGDLSYFVLKDQLGNRYGEFSLSFLTVPSPIDKKIYAYLTTKISELSSRLK